MVRPARFALSLVLAALCAIMPATGFAASPNGVAHLDPSRVFAPVTESLFAELRFDRPVSYVTASIFDDRAPFARLLAFADLPSQAPQGAGSGSVNFTAPRVASQFVPSAQPVPYSAPALSAASTVALVQAPQPQAVAPSALPLATASPISAVRFGTYSAYTAPVQRNEGAPIDVQLGKVRFETAFHAMQMCGSADEADACRWSADTPASAQRFSAGTDFNVRAGSRNLDVQLSSGIAHISPQSANVFRYVPLDESAAGGLTYAGLSDVVEQNVGAGVAVPVNRRLTVGVQFDRAHYQGDFLSPLSPSYAAMRDTYLGDVTYQLRGSGALTLSARQLRYQDLLAPNFNVTETRADLNFTVKF